MPRTTDPDAELDPDATLMAGKELFHAAKKHNTQMFATNSYNLLLHLAETLAEHPTETSLIRTSTRRSGTGDPGHPGATAAVLDGGSINSTLTALLEVH